MNVEALNCPNCGGAVASDRSVCDFCKSRLKTMACRSCLGLMFIGSKFCGRCGAIAAPVSFDEDDRQGDCPRCRKPMPALEVGESKFNACSSCDGLWLNASTFEAVCANSEQRSAVLSFFDGRQIHAQPLTKVNYVPCPDCGNLMNRSNFGKASGVIVDICKQHGLWFDSDELPAIVQFIQDGGMEMARQREKEEIRAEREKLRDEQRRHLAASKRSNLFGDEPDHTRLFVRSLFDI